MQNGLWLLLLLFIFNFSGLSAQWEIEDKNTFGGGGDENFEDMAPLSNGDFLAAGYSSSFDNEINNFGKFDFWIAQINTNADIVWQRNYGGAGNERAAAIVAADDDTFWVAGITDSTSKDVFLTFGENDIWLIQINETGDILQRNTFGGSENDQVNDLLLLEDGRLAIVGKTESQDGAMNANLGEEDAFLLLINPETAMLESAHFFGGSNDDSFQRIAQKNNGNLLVAGGTKSSDGDASLPTQGLDTWFMELDLNNDFTPVWSKKWGGNSAETTADLVLQSDDSFFICAETSSNSLPNFHGILDFGVAHFAANGDLIWQNCYGGTSAETPLKMLLTENETLRVLGYSFSFNGDIFSQFQAANLWLTAIAPASGVLQTNKVFGGNGFDEGSTIAMLPNEKLLITGNTDSFDGDLSGKTDVGILDGNHDVWIFTLKEAFDGNEVATLADLKLEFNSLVSSFFNLKIDNQTLQTIRIYDLSGRCFFEQKGIEENNISIDLSELKMGIYFVELPNLNHRIKILKD